MDKSWNQLADRCQLFFTAPSGLYKELLKEAELVMANKCSLYKEHFTYKFNTNIDSNSQVLPSNYKSMINVWVDGNLIPYRDKSNWTFTKGTDANYPVMTVQTGTPNYYDLASGHIVFDKIPSSSTTVDIYYRANVGKTLTKSVLVLPVAGGKAKINTDLGAEIIGAILICEDNGSANSITLDQLSTTSQQYVSPSQLQDYNNTVVGEENQICLTEYIGGGDWDANEPPTQLHLQQGWIQNYRNYAPLIDGDYHLDLCEYAIYIASAKSNPELSMKHLQIWEQRLTEVLTDNIDKELPIGMREEI
tara:strand:- start:7958 stop:8872 length:915 start_codon:yes stop_codon:yes gene_type:complete